MITITVTRSDTEDDPPSQYGETQVFQYTQESGSPVPMVGDRIVWEYTGMRVMERVWSIDTSISVELRVELE